MPGPLWTARVRDGTGDEGKQNIETAAEERLLGRNPQRDSVLGCRPVTKPRRGLRCTTGRSPAPHPTSHGHALRFRKAAQGAAVPFLPDKREERCAPVCCTVIATPIALLTLACVQDVPEQDLSGHEEAQSAHACADQGGHGHRTPGFRAIWSAALVFAGGATTLTLRDSRVWQREARASGRLEGLLTLRRYGLTSQHRFDR